MAEAAAAAAASKPRPGRYRIGSALIWGAALAGITWHTGQGLFASAGAFIGGAVTGWTVASLLRWITLLNAGYGVTAVVGGVLGLAVASGAVLGLKLLLQIFDPGRFDIKWNELGVFLMSWNAVPALILGVAIGLFVRSRIPIRRADP